MSAVSRLVIAVAVVRQGDCFLVGERPAGVSLAGHAEFPGGKVEPGETVLAAAERECREEAGIVSRADFEYLCVEHDYPLGRLTLHFIGCAVIAGGEQPRSPFRWVTRQELSGLTFPPANAALLRLLANE